MPDFGLDIQLVRSPIYTIYIEGTTVKARNNITGIVDYTADNTVNAVTAINSAINNIKDITNAGLDTLYGARIHLAAGIYKCTTNLLISDASGDANREGIALTGDGTGTILNYVPGSALTNAITFTNSSAILENMRIKGNSNVTNYIRVRAPSPGTNDWLGSRGKIQRVYFEGANWGVKVVTIVL